MRGEDLAYHLVLQNHILSVFGDSIKRVWEKSLNVTPSYCPRLLVSIRNVIEAEAAVAGGCDVLDIKEPVRGAMGMADVLTIAAVVDKVRRLASSVPVSVALGEAGDWAAESPVPRLPPNIAYLKLGTAGLVMNSGWTGQFSDVKQRFSSERHAGSSERGETASDGEACPVQWIAVGYADWEIARGPCPEAVIEGALECGCAGVLIDTFAKAHGRLLDCASVEGLESLGELARSNGLEFALAGRLQFTDLPRVATARPDIVGIRSAACRAGIRTGEIDAAAVRTFREALHSASRAFAPASRPLHAGAVRVNF